MKLSDIPAKFQIPFGNSAGGSYIRTVPVASQIGIQNGAASLTDGFPPLCFLPIASGGVPPFGQDFNGLLKQITQWSLWQGAGGPVPYDATFSAAIGGYPKGTLLATAAGGSFWLSTVDDNTTDPDTGGAGWSAFPPIASTTLSGISRLATVAETAAGASSSIAVTPAGLISNFTNSIGSSGYQKFPSGLILQWGSQAAIFDQSIINVSWPIAFPTACFTAWGQLSYTPAVSGTISCILNAPPTTTGAQFFGDNETSSASGTLYWFALGN